MDGLICLQDCHGLHGRGSNWIGKLPLVFDEVKLRGQRESVSEPYPETGRSVDYTVDLGKFCSESEKEKEGGDRQILGCDVGNNGDPGYDRGNLCVLD